MTMHQCPKCELRFTWQTELDDHCRSEHPEFHHDYPARGVRHGDAAPEVEPGERETVETVIARTDPATAARILSTYWNER